MADQYLRLLVKVRQDGRPFDSQRQMLEMAARAVGRIDRDGVRGATRVSVDEIAAMAGVLVTLGLVPVQPGEAFPLTLINPLQKESSHGTTES
ncbi:MAG: hypothetical protein KBF78_14135 [Fuscovulum sp.]|nr:hypothetical protein [Fuscovulum sp.]